MPINFFLSDENIDLSLIGKASYCDKAFCDDFPDIVFVLVFGVVVVFNTHRTHTHEYRE
jgi:hypothetical protein